MLRNAFTLGKIEPMTIGLRAFAFADMGRREGIKTIRSAVEGIKRWSARQLRKRRADRSILRQPRPHFDLAKRMRRSHEGFRQRHHVARQSGLDARGLGAAKDAARRAHRRIERGGRVDDHALIEGLKRILVMFLTGWREDAL